MEKLKIFKNYGCLARERRAVYTYSCEEGTAVCSDEIIVSVPEDWKLYETEMGDMACIAPWGWKYRINELLCGNEYPCFSAYDDNNKLHCVQLAIVKEEKEAMEGGKGKS